MIGTIKVHETVATLSDEGIWSSESSALNGYLNSVHSLEDSSPADGIRGWKQLWEAAEDLSGAVVHRQEVPEDEPGTIH